MSGASDTEPAGRPADPVQAAGERIAKRIARAGVCSRREAEALIREGRVKVDNRPVESPALDVTADQTITVDGRPLPEPEAPRLFRYHKPRGVLTTAHDEAGRPTVYDTLPPGLPRLMPVGRLDLNSEGLLLLTNDGELKRRLELPATGWIRRYKVRAYGRTDDQVLGRLANGVTVDGVAYGPIEARLERYVGDNAWLLMGLKEGKNREIRRVLEYLGLSVNRLIRLSYGPFQLGALDKRMIEEIPRKVLNDQLGLDIAAPHKAARAAPAPVTAEAASRQRPQRAFSARRNVQEISTDRAELRPRRAPAAGTPRPFEAQGAHGQDRPRPAAEPRRERTAPERPPERLLERDDAPRTSGRRTRGGSAAGERGRKPETAAAEAPSGAPASRRRDAGEQAPAGGPGIKATGTRRSEGAGSGAPASQRRGAGEQPPVEGPGGKARGGRRSEGTAPKRDRRASRPPRKRD